MIPGGNRFLSIGAAAGSLALLAAVVLMLWPPDPGDYAFTPGDRPDGETVGWVAKVESNTIHVNSGPFGGGVVPLVVTKTTRITVGAKDGWFEDIRPGGQVKVAYELYHGRRFARSVELLVDEGSRRPGRSSPQAKGPAETQAPAERPTTAPAAPSAAATTAPPVAAPPAPAPPAAAPDGGSARPRDGSARLRDGSEGRGATSRRVRGAPGRGGPGSGATARSHHRREARARSGGPAHAETRARARSGKTSAGRDRASTAARVDGDPSRAERVSPGERPTGA